VDHPTRPADGPGQIKGLSGDRPLTVEGYGSIWAARSISAWLTLTLPNVSTAL
jgi:hypothetical protein